MLNVWGTYLYQYLIGGLFFALSIFAIVKTGAVNLKLKKDRIWFAALIIGFVGLASVFALWTLLALHA